MNKKKKHASSRSPLLNKIVLFIVIIMYGIAGFVAGLDAGYTVLESIALAAVLGVFIFCSAFLMML